MKKIIPEFNKEEIDNLDASIENRYCSDDGRQAIVDGIMCFNIWSTSQIRILWVLKEAYDEIKDDKPWGGGWPLREILTAPNAYERIKPSIQTWNQVAYVSYGILNGFKTDRKIPSISKDDYSVLSILKKIAVINLSKLPGPKKSDRTQIENAYNANQDIIHKQFEEYKPNVIIFGNTFYDGLKSFLRVEEHQIKQAGIIEAVEQPDRIIIKDAHPQASGDQGDRPERVSDCVLAVEKWFTAG